MDEKVLSGQKIQMALLSHRDSHLLSAALHTMPIFSLRQMCTVRPVLLTTSAPLTCSRACGQYLIRAIEPKQFSEWVVCSELDSTCTVKTVCRLAQLVLKSSSASAGKCSPEEACHQSSLSLQARPEPSTYLAEGERRSGMTVAGQFHMSRDCIGLDGVATAVGLFSTFVRM